MTLVLENLQRVVKHTLGGDPEAMACFAGLFNENALTHGTAHTAT